MSAVVVSGRATRGGSSNSGPMTMAAAIVAVVMMVGALLAPNTDSVVNTTADLATAARALIDAPAVSAEELALQAQLEAVGSGLVFDQTIGSLDARFMLAGPVFGDTVPFSITTTQYQGETVAAVVPERDGDRIIYQRGEVTEWWQQVGSSYEQGWTVASAPADGSTTLSVMVGFANAAPLAESDTTVQLILSDGSRAWYRDLHAFDAEGTVLPATMSVDGSNVRIDVDAAGAVYPVTIDPILNQDQLITIPDSSTGDFFGEAIATDGNLMIVGVRGADRNVADQGRAEIYSWNGTGWDFVDELLSPVFDEAADFGWSVDINETSGHAVVGAPREDTNGVDAGAVHIYVDNQDGTWGLKQSIYECDTAGGPCGDTAAGGFDGSLFGSAVAIADNSRVAVGAPGAEGGEGRGFVYDPLPALGDPWQTSGTRELAASAPLSAGDRYGEAIDISADGAFVVAGVPGNPVGASSESGTVVLNTETAPGEWGAVDGDNGPSENDGQEFGASVAIGLSFDGDWIVVAGRPFRSRQDPNDTGTGGVRVYSITGTPGAEQLTTVGLGDITSPQADEGFGHSVAFDSLSGQVHVGAPFNTDGGPASGIVRSYQLVAGPAMDGGGGASAIELNKPSDWSTATGLDQYGFSVAAAPPGPDETYVAGSPGWVQTTPRRSPQAGRVTTTGPNFNSVFETAEITSAAAHDQHGWAVAVSGNRMAASAIGDDERTSQNGLIYTYERATETDPWVLDQLLVDPTPTDDAKPFGYSLDMEGDFLAIGSPGGNGQVDVFFHDGVSWTSRPSVLGDPAENLANDLNFGYDVAISTDGDVLVVSILGYDYAGGLNDRGAVRIFDWDGGNYVERTLLDDGTAFFEFGISLDMDEIPGSNDMRLVIGSRSDSMAIYNVDDGTGGNVQFDDFFDGPDDGTESVAIDDDRIVVASFSGTSDEVWLIERQPNTNFNNEWVERVLFDGVLFDTVPTPAPNNLVDVSGDTIVVGIEDEIAGGEVLVYYNDPAFGWGTESALLGWGDGSVDQIVPSFQAPSLLIGRAVAIDGASATKSIVFGATGADSNGVNAGTVYAKSRVEAGNPEPANKLTVDTFGPGLFGSAISIREGSPTAALVAETGLARVHYLQFDGSLWSIVSTFDHSSPVIDVDFKADGRAVALLEDGSAVTYQETCVNLGGVPSCGIAPTPDSGSFIGTNPRSVAIAGGAVYTAGADGDQLSANTFGVGDNLPVGGPGGLVVADEFGASMDSSGTIIAIGAPGADGNDGRVYLFDANTDSYISTIDSTLGPGTAGRFGTSVAIDGNILVVGAPTFDADGSIDGVVEVLDISGALAGGAGPIVLDDTLIPSGGSGLSTWGTSVDLDGDVIVVGGTGFEESGIPFRHGAAVAYGFDGADWVETDNFTATDIAAADEAGFAVGVAGTDVLVGARSEDNPQGVDAGAVYSYVATPAAPAVPNKITIGQLGLTGDDRFGRSVDVQGDWAVVGEPGQDGGPDAGQVHVLQNVAGSWTIVQTVGRTGVVGSDRFGWDVALDGNQFVVASKNDGFVTLFERPDAASPFVQVDQDQPAGVTSLDSVAILGDIVGAGSIASGTVDFYRSTGGTLTSTWGTTRTDAQAGDEYGTSLAIGIDGGCEYAVVGAPGYDTVGGADFGRAYVYGDICGDGAQGTDEDQILQGTAGGPGFGQSLAADGSNFVVGHDEATAAQFGGADAVSVGTAYVYSYSEPSLSATLTQELESVDFTDHNGINDGYGGSVDIDGDVVVIGARAAVEQGGTISGGAAYAWVLDAGTWVEQQTYRASDRAIDDRLGLSVAVSGTSILVGAPDDDNPQGTDAGAVYAFGTPAVPDNPTLSFDFGLDAGSPTAVDVAPNGIAVTEFNPEVLEDAAEDDTTIAASSLGSTNVEGSPLSALPLSALPLSALATDPASVLGSIPLVEIDLEGGWEQLFEDTGSSLGEVPLANLTLSDVVADAAANAELFQNTSSDAPTLAALNVQGTPLSALPLSALVLGSIPLSALPGPDWCTILAPYVAGTCTDIEDISLFEATLSGVPLSALPLSALPLSALPLSALPISDLPLSALDLGSTPLSALPLSALPLSALDVQGSPLSALPLSALPVQAPLSALPLSALPLSALELNGTPLSALPLSALPLSALELSNVPLSALEVEGAPLSALPLSALPLSALVLADVPLSALPLSALDASLPDWCELLSDIDSGYDCTFAATEADFLNNNTIVDLGVRGVPLSALPLSALPLSALPVGTLPLSALPLSALPLSALPLSALPLSALELQGTPLSALATGSTPLSALPLSALDVQGSPLSALPLSALPLSALPVESVPLSALPLSALPLSALPLSALTVDGAPLSALPLSALDLDATPLSALPLSALPLSALGVDCALVDCDIDTLNEAIVAGAVDPATITIADIQASLSGISLGDITGGLLSGAEQDVIDFLLASGLFMDSLSGFDDLLLGELPLDLPVLQDVTLADLNAALFALRLSDLVGAIIDPATGQPFPDGDVQTTLETFVDDYDFQDWEYLGDATFGDLLSGGSGTLPFSELGPILGLIHVRDLTGITNLDALLGDAAVDLGDLTLLDLFGFNFTDGSGNDIDTLTLGELLEQAQLADELYGFSVSDLLLALLGLDSTPFSNLDFTEVETGLLPASLIPPVKFSAQLEVNDTVNDQTVTITVQLPATATYIPGSGQVDGAALEPTIGDNTLDWTLVGVAPDTAAVVDFDVKPTISLGASSLSATGAIIGTDVDITTAASVEVREGSEPNDFPATTTAAEDTVYLTYISSETDNDVYQITVGENDQLAIQLSSLTVDLDFAVYGDPANNAVNAALTAASDEAPLEPITDPDQEGADTEPLNDFRRLDDEDSNLQFIDLSNSPGTETELLVTSALPAGTYYVQVFGANGATNVEPAALQIQVIDADGRPACSAQGAIGGATGTAPALAGSTANTLILVNQQRTEALYPGEWADLNSELTELVDFLEDPANDGLGIDPIVVPVDGIGAIQAAYAAWDGDAACTPESANAVVASIIENVVDPLRGTLEHIVVVGGDPVIPMARLLDVTEIANEYDYRYEFIGDNGVGGNADNINALSASFWDRQYLSDEPYGESAARSLGNRFLYVSDIALGRMVETPDEIEAQLQHFQDFDGTLQADTAAVLGYDFLADSSTEIAADLVDAGLATVDDELAIGFNSDGDKWDKDDAADKVIPVGEAPDLISLNGHFDHYRALPSDGDQVPNFNDNFLASTVLAAPPGTLDGSIIFSMGCHGGLSVSDLQINATNGDWAQTFAADQAIFVGNTGFGYGDTEAVAYTEKLMALFAEQAVRPVQLTGTSATTTIGQALTFAKNEYASDLSVFSVYDEKALMESTFYGLPFYRVGDVDPVPAEPVPTNTTLPDATGVESLTVTADPVNALQVTDLGSIYSNPDENGDPQTIVAPGMPIQPSQSVDISVVDPADTTALGTVARGAVVLDMESTYVSPVDPVVSTAIFNESSQQPEPDLGDVVFPAKPVTINSSTTPSGDRQTLVLATGQFNSDGLVQRLDDNIDVVVYYADAADDDFTAPTIGAVESALVATAAGAELTVSLSVEDMGGADAPVVERVYLLVAPNPGTGAVDWVGVDLVEGANNEWSGTALLAATTSEVEFLVQAVDGSGNVGFATNKARNFNDDDTVVPEPPAPDLDVAVDQTDFDVTAEWYTAPVVVSVDSGDLDATYLIQPGGVETPVPASGVFTVGDDGTNTVTVTRSDGQSVTTTIRIDTQNPTVTIAPPEDASTFFESDVPNIGFLCQDISLASCDATVDTVPIDNAAPLPNTLGVHIVSVEAVDALGNTATATSTYTVVADPVLGDPPVITESEVDGIALPGAAIDLAGEFVDGVGPFSIDVDWGNGDVCPGSGSCSVEAPGAGMPGTFDASYTYPVGGQYTIVVTITDANGGVATTTLSTATCTITGTSGNDVIWGTGGDDVICGLGGNDRINGRAGADLIYGGAGNDVIRGANGSDTIFGGRDSDVILGQNGDDTLIGGKGGDLINGGAGADTLKGRSGNDILIGSSGHDTLRGNRGSDQLYGGNGNDMMYGGRDDDFLSGWYGADQMWGGAGDDSIFGDRGSDTISGGWGNDFVNAGGEADVVSGNQGDDDLRGGWGNDEIDGGDGTDRCRGNSGNDQLTACET